MKGPKIKIKVLSEFKKSKFDPHGPYKSAQLMPTVILKAPFDFRRSSNGQIQIICSKLNAIGDWQS